MDENDQKKPRKARASKPALSRRGHPKRTDPVAERFRQIADEKFPGGGARDFYPTDDVVRDSRGRFLKGARTPNPEGRGAGRGLEVDRRFGMSQTVQDMLELLEQPVPIRKGKVRKQVPAIIALYDRMIHMAIQGDWNAIKKCVELREKYSDFREKTLKGLMEEAQACRQRYKDYGEEMPEHVKSFLEYVEERITSGQFEAG
jgi:hypothetical protein